MPDWKPELRRRLAHLHLAPSREAAIVEEIAQHLDGRYDDLRAGGATAEQADAAVRVEVERAELLAGRLATLALARTTETPPAGATWRRGAGVWQDFRHAVRSLARSPAFSAIACGTLAAGIGVTTAMFGLMNGLLFRPLPYPNADDLSRLYRVTSGSAYEAFTAGEFNRLAPEATGVAELAAYAPSPVGLEDAGAAAEWLSVTPNLFHVLGLRPALGRDFAAAEDAPGAGRVAVISDSLWNTRFDRDPDVIGRTLRTGADDYIVIGILPPEATDHRLFGRVGLFSPVDWAASRPAADGAATVAVIARRAAGVSDRQLEAWLTAFASGEAQAVGTESAGATRGWRSEPLPRTATGPTGRVLLGLLLALAASVLAIGCANLGHLVLARTLERSQEIAVRTALGASPLQLARGVAFEATSLAGVGAAGGLLLALWITSWLHSVLAATGGPSLHLPIDWRVAAFACGLALCTALFFSLVPVVLTSRIDSADALKAGGRGATASRSQHRARHLLVAVQIALALMLVAGAAAFVQGASRALARDHGWSAEDVVQAEISVPAAGRSDAEVAQLFRGLVAEARALPGSAGASISYGLPYLGLRGGWRIAGDDRPWHERGAGLGAELNGVYGDYFAVTGTPLLAGRVFDDGDTALAPGVAIVSASLARALFGEAPAVGRRVAEVTDAAPQWVEIVGVVGDVTTLDITRSTTRLQIYQPALQDLHRQATLAVRSSGPSAGQLTAPLRRLLSAAGPDILVRNLMPAAALADREVVSQMRLVLRLFTAFAAIGVLLAALGTYAVMARMVAQRTLEMGLRMALGAHAAGIVRLVLASALRVVATGAVVGLAGALALLAIFRSIFPGIEVGDVLTLAAAASILTAVALLAAWAPARRAARVDPVTALRSE